MRWGAPPNASPSGTSLVRWRLLTTFSHGTHSTPTLSSCAPVRSPAATCPSRRPRALVYSRRWSWSRVAGPVSILAAAVGFVVYQQVSKPGPQSGSVQPASQAAPKPTFRSRTDPPSTAQGSRGPTPAPEPSREPENPVVRDSRVASAERRAVQQLTAGSRDAQWITSRKAWALLPTIQDCESCGATSGARRSGIESGAAQGC